MRGWPPTSPRPGASGLWITYRACAILRAHPTIGRRRERFAPETELHVRAVSLETRKLPPGSFSRVGEHATGRCGRHQASVDTRRGRNPLTTIGRTVVH